MRIREDLRRDLRRRAVDEEETEQTLLNQALENFLRVKPLRREKVGNGLLKYSGIWTKEEGDEFGKYIEERFEQIDKEE